MVTIVSGDKRRGGHLAESKHLLTLPPVLRHGHWLVSLALCGEVSQLIPPTKGDLLVTGGAAWDSASIRRIESAFFSRVRRSSGDRSSVCSGTYLSGMLIFSGSQGWNSPLYVLRTTSGASRGFSMRSMSMSSLARARPSCRASASCTAG